MQTFSHDYTPGLSPVSANGTGSTASVCGGSAKGTDWAPSSRLPSPSCVTSPACASVSSLVKWDHESAFQLV